MGKGEDRPVYYIIIRYLVLGFNLLFLIFGAIFIGIGIWIRVDDDAIYSVVSKGSPVAPSILMITVGSIIFVVSFIGFLGAFKENRCLLLAYSSILTFLLVAEIVLVSLAIVYHNEIEDFARDEINDSIKKSYDESGEADVTKGIDKMQEKFECCGTVNYTDWVGSRWASRNSAARVPKSCCKNANAEPNCNLKTASLSGIYTKPCLEELKDWAKENLVIIASIGGVLAFIEFCGILMALLMIKHNGNDEKV